MSNFGTTPGAVLVPGMNADVIASALPSGAATSALQSSVGATNHSDITALGTSALATDAHLTALGTTALATDAHMTANTSAITALGTGALATDAHLTSVIAATGAAPSASAVLTGTIGGGATGGHVNGLIQADSSAAINVSTATTTQLVALSAGRKIYVTEFNFLAAAADNVTFEYGTGTTCGTGTTILTGAYPAGANGGISAGRGLGPVLVVPAGNALCIVTSAATQLSGSVAYSQF